MNILQNSKFVLRIPSKTLVPVKYAFYATNYRQFAATANREWIDLEAICKTGKIPRTFNFARDVFEKHVVSVVTCNSVFFELALSFTVKNGNIT